MAKYVLCPRCELNYMPEGDEYCDVCKAELKKGPQLVFAVDEEETESLELCPKCRKNYLKPGETICEECAKKPLYEEDTNLPDENDESWKEYLDDTDEDEDKEESEEMLSLSRIAEEEGDELFDDEEEDDLISESVEPDDFEIPEVDESDFEDTDEEESEEDEEEDF